MKKNNPSNCCNACPGELESIAPCQACGLCQPIYGVCSPQEQALHDMKSLRRFYRFRQHETLKKVRYLQGVHNQVHNYRVIADLLTELAGYLTDQHER